MSLHRFQMDMTREELLLVDRLGQLAALRTRKEVISNAIAFYHWATKELLMGRTICSIDEATQKVKQYDSHAMSAISEKAASIKPLSEEQIEFELKQPSITTKELLAKANGAKNAASIEMVGISGSPIHGTMESGS